MSKLTLAEHKIVELQEENAGLRRKLDNRKKLSKRDVTILRDMYSSGYSQTAVADVFDVNPATVSRIVRNEYH